MRWIATWSAVLAAVASIALSAQLRCETDRRLRELDRRADEGRIRDEGVLARVANVDGALRKAFPDVNANRWWCITGACSRTIEQCEKWRAISRAASQQCEPARMAWCFDGEIRFGAPASPGMNFGIDLCYQTLAGCMPAAGVFVQRGNAVSCCIGVE